MRSEELNLAVYDTDKIQHHYLEVYDPVLSRWVDKEVKLLEIGVRTGGSLELWRDYFPKGTIAGIDLELPPDFIPGERIQLFKGSQADTQFLSQVAASIAPEGFDIIIDDASHIGELTKTTFWHLFHHHLKPGGLYVIEDWGTGYFDDFPDGKKFDPQPSSLDPFPCHNHGMVGFVKELVDEQAAGSITLARKEPFRLSRFGSLVITEGVVLVTKMAPSLSAFPNPVPAGVGPGQTTISWNSVDGKVYVSINGREELLFSGSPRGSQQANWIQTGSTQEFRLYNADHDQLLAKVIVTRDERKKRSKRTHSLSAFPNPVPAGEGPGQTTISWNSVDGKVYVSTNGREELLFAGSPRGSQQANWIEAGSIHEFRLYNANHDKLLAKVKVTRNKRNKSPNVFGRFARAVKRRRS